MLNVERWVYDIETVINCFTLTAMRVSDGEIVVFEVSDRCNDLPALVAWLEVLRESGAQMVGYNNVGFDWPVCQWIMLNQHRATSAESIYRRAQEVIESEFSTIRHPLVQQIDLYLIAHFNNVARRTSLKRLIFNMRGKNLQEMGHDHSQPIAPELIDELLDYNLNDVRETMRFYSTGSMQAALDFRETLGPDYTNLPDAGLGKRTVENELNVAGVRTRDGRSPLQTVRDDIRLRDIILPQIDLKLYGFWNVLEEFRATTVDANSLSFSRSATVRGLQYDFGLGGVHASVERSKFVARDGVAIVDLDVASMYPSIAIVNRFYPEHLTEQFCSVYRDIYDRRLEAKRNGDKTLDAMLKLALNAVYGDSNNRYSFLYDTRYTLSITINGQLLIAMLVESLLEIEGVTVIQVNTDGVTIVIPENRTAPVRAACSRWEQMSGLVLEHNRYSAMWVRDVNNYVARKTNGDLKLKGAYELQPELHKNHSNIVSRRAAIENMVNGRSISRTVGECLDLFDFALLARRSGPLEFEIDGVPQQRNVRYYVSTGGDKLLKRSPALGPVGAYKLKRGVTTFPNDPYTWHEQYHTKSKTKYEDRVSGVEARRTVKVINKMPSEFPDDIDYDYYIDRARRLVI